MDWLAERARVAIACGVLVIGLDPYRVSGPWDPKPVSDAIERGLVRFEENHVGVQACLVSAGLGCTSH
jgi:hypothetical protein